MINAIPAFSLCLQQTMCHIHTNAGKSARKLAQGTYVFEGVEMDEGNLTCMYIVYGGDGIIMLYICIRMCVPRDNSLDAFYRRRSTYRMTEMKTYTRRRRRQRT